MQSYFFVPANRLHKIDAMQSLKIDHIIIDLEDAIKSSQREDFLQDLASETIDRSHFIRVPLYDQRDQMDLDLYEQLQNFGYYRFIFPKIQSKNDFEIIQEKIKPNEEIVLLVETALFFVQLPQVLEKYHDKISGLGIGSHDLMNEIGGEHTLENITFYRNQLLLLAIAYQKTAFDVASMELKDEEAFKTEILDGFSRGFDAKFYIHPWQIKMKDQLSFYNQADLDWATKIYTEFEKVGDEEEFNPIVVDGEIIEKPHLNKVFKIIKYFNTHESK